MANKSNERLFHLHKHQHPHSWIAPATGQLEGVSEPHSHDVICGRGGGSNNFVGNKSWRYLVANRKVVYARAPKRIKMQIAGSIVDAVRRQNPPGRFLAKDEKTGKYNDIGNEKALEKTSQALREGQPDIKNQLKKQEELSRSFVASQPATQAVFQKPQIAFLPPAIQQCPFQQADATQQPQANGVVPFNTILPFHQQAPSTNPCVGGTVQSAQYQSSLLKNAAALRNNILPGGGSLAQVPLAPYTAALLRQMVLTAQIQQKQVNQVQQKAAASSHHNDTQTEGTKLEGHLTKTTSVEDAASSALPVNVSNGADRNSSRIKGTESISIDSLSTEKQNGQRGDTDKKSSDSDKCDGKGKGMSVLITCNQDERTTPDLTRDDPVHEEDPMEVAPPPTSLKRFVSVESASSEKSKTSSFMESSLPFTDPQDSFSFLPAQVTFNNVTREDRKDVANKEDDLTDSFAHIVANGLVIPCKTQSSTGNEGLKVGMVPTTTEQAQREVTGISRYPGTLLLDKDSFANSKCKPDGTSIHIIEDQPPTQQTTAHASTSSKSKVASAMTAMLSPKQKPSPPDDGVSHGKPNTSVKRKLQVHDRSIAEEDATESTMTSSKKRKKVGSDELNTVRKSLSVEKRNKDTKKSSLSSLPAPDSVASAVTADTSRDVHQSFSHLSESRPTEQNHRLELHEITSLEAAMLADSIGKAASKAFLASIAAYQNSNSREGPSPFTIADDVAVEAHRVASSIILPLICKDANGYGFHPQMQDENNVGPEVINSVGEPTDNTDHAKTRV